MRRRILHLSVALLLSAVALRSQPNTSPSGSLKDTVMTATPPSPKDTAKAKSRADSVVIIKHSFDHRRQIITGSVVMTCLLAVLAIMNNYNPR